MKTGFPALLVLISLIFVRCGEEIPATDPIFDNKLPVSKRIRLAFEKDFLQGLGIASEDAAAIAAFYRSRSYRPLWTNDSVCTPKGEMLSKIFARPHCIGIPDTRWKKTAASEKAVIAKELLLTAQLGFALHDLQAGILDTATKSMKPVKWAEMTHVASAVRESDTVKNWGAWFAGKGPAHNDYRRIATGLFAYSFDKSFSEKTFKLPTMKEDSAKCYDEARRSLIDKGYLQEQMPDSVFLLALETFQTENGLKPDGVIGTYTREALEESAAAKIERAVLSLERWRWRSPFPDRYVWINIPEYMLRIYYNDTLYSEHRVVVGKRDTKTPELESRIRSIVSYPYWTVPYSIKSKEILPAMQRNPGYAARNHYKLFRGSDEEIDPYSVNWSRIRENAFPYKVRQEPGTFNSLGVVKFEFSNPYGVYVHDTPSKGLFGTDIRSYSHGCIRCNLPDSLARFMLRRDEQKYMTADSLDTMLGRQQHRSIALRHPITIKVDYITVTASNSNKLTFYPDIYGRDAAYVKWFHPEN